MNLPNKLTVLRVVIIPLFLVFYFARAIPWNYLWALLVFAAASLTDMLDGHIARKHNLVTDFGKLMDPLADKLLVMAAMICLVADRLVAAWVVIVILAREFLVTSIRLVAAGSGQVLAADRWGKLKTVFQMCWLVFDLLLLAADIRLAPDSISYPTALQPIITPIVALRWILLAGSLILTVISGANYCRKNRGLFRDL